MADQPPGVAHKTHFWLFLARKLPLIIITTIFHDLSAVIALVLSLSHEQQTMNTAPIVLAALAGIIILIGAASLINLARRKKGPNGIDV
jgi:hypothetical protein